MARVLSLLMPLPSSFYSQSILPRTSSTLPSPRPIRLIESSGSVRRLELKFDSELAFDGDDVWQNTHDDFPRRSTNFVAFDRHVLAIYNQRAWIVIADNTTTLPVCS